MLRKQGVRLNTSVPGILLAFFGLPGLRALGAQDTDPAARTGQSFNDSLPVLLAESSALAAQGQHALAAETLITAFEMHPDPLWDRDDYWRSLVRGFQGFAKLTPDERTRLLGQHARAPRGQGKTQAPFFNQLTDWMHDALPGTSLRSPGAKLIVAGWHYQMGDYPTAAAQAMAVIQMAPDSLAAEYGAMALVLSRIYRRDFAAGSEDVRLVTSLMPDTGAAAWAVVQLNWWYGRLRQPDLAKDLDKRVISRTPASRAGRVAGTMLALIEAAEARRYELAVELFEQIQQYNDLAEVDVILDTLLVGIPWLERRDARFKTAAGEAIAALEGLSKQEDRPFSSQVARLLLARLHMRLSKPKEAICLLVPFTASDDRKAVLKTRAHALASIGAMEWRSNPHRATQALEAFADDYLDLPWSDSAVLMLAGLYLKQHRNQDALEAFGWLKDRRELRTSLWPAPQDQITAGIAGALMGLGRASEAWQTIRPLVSRMPRDELMHKLGLLSREGFAEQAGFVRQRIRTNAEAETP